MDGDVPLETLNVCKICFNSTSHKSNPTLTPLARAIKDGDKQKCPACTQDWWTQLVAKDPDLKKWVSIRPRPKIDTKVDYQMCVSVQKRHPCPKGPVMCTFAHSKAELLQWNRDRWRQPRPVPAINGAFQFQFCKHMYNTGNCPYGQRCTFAHSEEELSRWAGAVDNNLGASESRQIITRDISGDYVCHICHVVCNRVEEHIDSLHHRQMLSVMRENPMLGHPGHRGVVRPRPQRVPFNGYKLCSSLESGRRCYYGEACTFAHNQEELMEWNGQFEEMRQGTYTRPTHQYRPQLNSNDLDDFDTSSAWDDEDVSEDEYEEETSDFAQEMRARVQFSYHEKEDLPGLEVCV